MDDAKKILSSLYDIGDKAGKTTVDRMKGIVKDDYERGKSAKELELDLKSPNRASDRAKKTEDFRDGVETNKPKKVDKPSPGLEEDKTPSGGPLKRAKGGALGCGAAMRGYGAVRKK